MIKRNMIMRLVSENDPGRFRSRVVKPEKGRGRKDRPRNKKGYMGDVS